MIHAIEAMSDRFVAVGRNGRRAVSLDGATWAHSVEGPHGDWYYAVDSGGGRVLAVGGQHRYFASVSGDGGMTWTHTHWNGLNHARLRSTVWYQNRFLVSGSDSQHCLFESQDGQQFTPVAWAPGGACPYFLGVVGGALIAAQAEWQQATTLLRSTDGTTWTPVHTSPTDLNVYQMAAERVE